MKKWLYRIIFAVYLIFSCAGLFLVQEKLSAHFSEKAMMYARIGFSFFGAFLFCAPDGCWNFKNVNFDLSKFILGLVCIFFAFSRIWIYTIFSKLSIEASTILASNLPYLETIGAFASGMSFFEMCKREDKDEAV